MGKSSVLINISKILFSMFFLCMSIAAKSQYLNMKTFVVNENLRKELLLINHYLAQMVDILIIYFQIVMG